MLTKIDTTKEILREYSLKVTPARIAILGNFSKGCNPMNAEDIYVKIKKEKIDLVTVYRTLALFEQRGLLRRVAVRKDSIYFELAEEHHHHVICTNCERISDFANADDEKLIAKALTQVKDFKEISYHSFDLFGICNACLKR